MKNSAIITLIVLFGIKLNAQVYVAGDTTGYYVYYPEYTFLNAGATIDIDCDDSVDIEFHSNEGGHVPNNWPRLSFYMAGAEVLNSGVGNVTRFYKGDTIPFTDSLWTPWLDFIWGQGVMGAYGVQQIDTAYIAFRKRNGAGDTVYAFLNVSTLNTQMTIHQIISECASDPLQRITAVNEVTDYDEWLVSPNPFSNRLIFSGVYSKQASISLYNFQGQQVLQSAVANYAAINTGQLANGVYFYKLWDDKGVVKTGKVVKQ